jgi:hypothetical protein
MVGASVGGWGGGSLGFVGVGVDLDVLYLLFLLSSSIPSVTHRRALWLTRRHTRPP